MSERMIDVALGMAGAANRTCQQIASQFVSTEAQEQAPVGPELIDETGWTSTGWTGDYATGFTHTAGNTSPLSRSITDSGTKTFMVSFDSSAALVADELYVTIGSSVAFDLYAGDITHYDVAIKSISNGNIVFTPISGFSKTISNISVKEIIGTTNPTFVISDSDGAESLEIRPVTSSRRNVYVGTGCGETGVTDAGNIGIGSDALKQNVSGFWNVAAGANALESNVGGSRNIGVGYKALTSNTSGQRNQGVGSFALQANKSGIKNTAIGSDALYENVSGSWNVAIAFAALYKNTGNYNIGIGVSSGQSRTTGDYNVSIGANSHEIMTGGSHNIGIGYGVIGGSGSNILHNTAVGAYSLRACAGNGNIALGYKAGDNITSGSNNIIIGYDIDAASATGSNQLNIGGAITGSIASGSVSLTIGGALSVSTMKITALPTSDPAVAGALWNSSGTVKVSAG